MRYQGGKSRIASALAAVIFEREREREIWEPFCGGGAVTYELAKAGFQVHASDNHEDLILMWQALKRGETEPFVDVTEEEFKALKTAPSSARRGFVRFGGSFGGDFNGGYGRHHRGDGDPHRQYVWQDSQRSLQKFRGVLAGVDFTLCEYSAIPDDVLVYADPPYAGVYAYQGRNFDHKAFWLWVRSRRGPTYVSELTGPEDIAVVWRKPHKSLAACNAPANQATSRIIEREERLYYMPAKQ
jgi:site-specific DNA-adenine methylase